MIVLTEEQQDALKELINMGFSRTAASLSELTGDRVQIEVSEVSIYPINELVNKLPIFIQGEVASISQIFTGPVSGNAILLLNYDGALILTHLLAPNQNKHTTYLDTSDCEVLIEIGNILLNACMGVFGNILEIRFLFDVPNLHLEPSNKLPNLLGSNQPESEYALGAYTAFQLGNNSVKGYLMIVLGVTSLNLFIQSIDDWKGKAIQPVNFT